MTINKPKVFITPLLNKKRSIQKKFKIILVDLFRMNLFVKIIYLR